MARHLVRSLCVATIAGVLVLQACGKSPSVSSERATSAPAADRLAAADSVPNDTHAGWKRHERFPIAAVAPAQSQTEDPPPWLVELLHAPDPNVRIQGLDAWARHPGASLDPVTYALVDPDEGVRTRAQEVLEQELARR